MRIVVPRSDIQQKKKRESDKEFGRLSRGFDTRVKFAALTST